jgi:hypothetical protein
VRGALGPTAVLLPGESVAYGRQVGMATFNYFDAAPFEALVTFSDTAGVRWVRKPDGDLQELEQ